jgi:hypothetical protein
MMASPHGPGVRSHCRFRYRGTEHARKSGNWMSGGTKRQCDRALHGPIDAELTAYESS